MATTEIGYHTLDDRHVAIECSVCGPVAVLTIGSIADPDVTRVYYGNLHLALHHQGVSA